MIYDREGKPLNNWKQNVVMQGAVYADHGEGSVNANYWDIDARTFFGAPHLEQALAAFRTASSQSLVSPGMEAPRKCTKMGFTLLRQLFVEKLLVP